MDSVLRPRDIQARIRSGESPETVAAAAQTTVEKIMPFAQPVLAERAFVAQQAQRASVRRRAGEGAPGQLGTAVAERLTAVDVDPEAVEWDAWRRDDGRWTLVAAYDAAGGPERAEFVYDAAGRYVTATDEPSRRLVGERLPGATPPAAAASGAEGAPGVAADQLHLGDDAIELVTGRRPQPPVDEVVPPEPVTALRPAPVPEPVDPRSEERPAEEPAEEPAEARLRSDERDEITVDLTEPANAVRRARPVADPDWMATQASERPPAPEAETLFEVPPATPAPEPSPAGQPDADVLDSSPPSEDTETSGAADEPSRSARAKATRSKAAKGSKGSKGRAAIPSWDEIMFGSSTGD